MSDPPVPDSDSPGPEPVLDPPPEAMPLEMVPPETTDPERVSAAGPAPDAGPAPPTQTASAPEPAPAPDTPQRAPSGVAPLPPPPPAPLQLTGPEIHQKLSALFLEVLPLLGLEKLLNIMAVYVKTCERELWAEGEIRLEVFHRPLDQNHIPPELIAKVVGHLVLYVRRFILAPFALPAAIREETVQAIADVPDPEALVLDLYNRVESRLSAQSVEARRQADRHAEAVEAARTSRRLAAVQPRHEPLFRARVNKNQVLRIALASLMFLATVGYWINFALSQLHKETIDPRAHLNYLDPENFASVLQIEKARVSMGTLFVLVPPGKLAKMSDDERQSAARRLLDILQRPDVKNVNLRDDTTQVHISVRR